MLHYYWRTFHALKSDELYEIIAFRQAVFIIEQKCIYPDLDYQDQGAMHLLGTQDNKLVAYLRLLLNNSPYPDAISFGRVAVTQSARHQGIGTQLIRETLNYINHINTNKKPIIIGAQVYLKKFYEGFDFITMGQPYNEDGIPHIKMIKLC